jgi:hypothetical protein
MVFQDPKSKGAIAMDFLNHARPFRVFSYVRFSAKRQARGRSLLRQTELRDAWLARHPEATLDATLSLRDFGVSSFRGENASQGELRASWTRSSKAP